MVKEKEMEVEQMVEKESKEVKEVKEEKYKLGQVVTATGISILENGEAISDSEALVLILNKLEDLNKKL